MRYFVGAQHKEKVLKLLGENCNFVKTVKKFDILMIPKMVEKIVTSSPPIYSRVVSLNKLKVDLGKMTSSA